MQQVKIFGRPWFTADPSLEEQANLFLKKNPGATIQHLAFTSIGLEDEGSDGGFDTLVLVVEMDKKNSENAAQV